MKRIGIIQFAAGHVQGALRIHHHTNTGALDEDVPILRLVLEVHLVLEARAPPADHGDAQNSLRSPLLGQQTRNLATRALGELDEPLVPHPEGRLLTNGGSNFSSNHCCSFKLRTDPVQVNEPSVVNA